MGVFLGVHRIWKPCSSINSKAKWRRLLIVQNFHVNMIIQSNVSWKKFESLNCHQETFRFSNNRTLDAFPPFTCIGFLKTMSVDMPPLMVDWSRHACIPSCIYNANRILTIPNYIPHSVKHSKHKRHTAILDNSSLFRLTQTVSLASEDQLLWIHLV